MSYNNTVLNNVYNYYLTAYSPKSSSRYDTHKKSELRSVYNSIVKLNKESPLYKLDTSRESKNFAVGIKEDARELRNIIASIGGLDEQKILNKKTAYSSNEDIAAVSYIGGPISGTDVPSYDIEVHSLASGQVTMGHFLPNTKIKLSPDTYSFDIAINDMNFEFQYNIKEGETNKAVHKRLSKLITNADIGLHAEVIEDGKGSTSLRLRSVSKGLRDNNSSIFIISDDHTSKKSGSVDYFGLDYLVGAASNAEFTMNGTNHTSVSNNFTIDNLFDISLTGVSSMEGETANIGLKTDVESLTENISTLVTGYNNFIQNTAAYKDDFLGSHKLLRQMKGIAGYFRSEFDILGLKLTENGKITLDKQELKHAALSEYAREDFAALRNFVSSVVYKMEQISLNPMEYVNKTVVAYKNPGKNYATPYITSAFSGLFFNDYC